MLRQVPTSARGHGATHRQLYNQVRPHEVIAFAIPESVYRARPRRRPSRWPAGSLASPLSRVLLGRNLTLSLSADQS